MDSGMEGGGETLIPSSESKSPGEKLLLPHTYRYIGGGSGGGGGGALAPQQFYWGACPPIILWLLYIFMSCYSWLFLDLFLYLYDTKYINL